MRRIWHLMIMLSMLWCGLHFDSPAQAAVDFGVEHHFSESSAPNDGEGETGGPAKAAHGGHHHCPLAPDQVADPIPCGSAKGDNLLAQREALGLKSRSQAPPLQPPAA